MNEQEQQGVKVGRWWVDVPPHEGFPPMHEIPVQCTACGEGNLRWINLSAGGRSGAPNWRLYKIGSSLTGGRAELHECAGTDPQ